MTIDERQRYQLHQTLEAHLGPEAAATLMAHLPPVGWADVATKHDLKALEERLELRLGIEIAGVRTEIHKVARTMTLTTVGATAAIVTVAATLTNLFG
ncbi:MAG: hypothetical protein EA389_15020 [Ilumatobacter sp.]|nr:MAG: hypothetical protein EA389_15020 [Ilumatobacter sp.]